MAKDQGTLGGRKKAVLSAVVTEYVRTGEPVGSETISERYQLGVSPATIRNEMSALEEMGYLSHPHTSAGRIPTDIGYRHYVDSLPAGGRLREAQRRAIGEFFKLAVLDLEEVLRGTTQLLSRLTQYAGLAVPPSASDERIVRIELVGIGSAVLILLVDQHGRVYKRIFDRPKGLEDAHLQPLSNRFSQVFGGLSPPEAMARALDLARRGDPQERAVLLPLTESFTELLEGSIPEHMLVGGVANLAGEVSSWRHDTVRRLFEALETESEVIRLLREVSGGEGLSVTIGEEHPATGRWDAAVVAAPYRVRDVTLGSIGVVGPTRMDYLSVIAAVRAVARRVSDLATQLEGSSG
jgi:heat-inducible transcriptional repressor